jgi:hypothetical protein
VLERSFVAGEHIERGEGTDTATEEVDVELPDGRVA